MIATRLIVPLNRILIVLICAKPVPFYNRSLCLHRAIMLMMMPKTITKEKEPRKIPK
jgi:hypothetical protein